MDTQMQEQKPNGDLAVPVDAHNTPSTQAPCTDITVTADFPIIAMGHGKVEVGDGEWEGMPVLWFGNDGQGIGHERTRGHALPVQDRETLAMFSFANIHGLEAIEAAVARLRARMAPPEATEHHPLPTEWRITAPDGRDWYGDTALRACAAAQRDTVDPVLAMQRINAVVAEETALHKAEMAAEFERGRQHGKDEAQSQCAEGSTEPAETSRSNEHKEAAK